ncbi:MAG: formate dehydrogenase accessory protein FdhE [Burkholderiaceae bacterium]
MKSSEARPLLSPEEIAVRSGQEVAFLHFPRRAEVFAERDLRLRQLAAGHSMRDYLIFMADLARAQHDLLQAYPATVLPDGASIEQASGEGRPLLDAATWPRDASWREGLGRILDAMLPRLPEGPARETVLALKARSAEDIEQQAGRLLSNIMFGLDLAAAPFIAAALQAYFTHLLIATQDAHGQARLAPFGRTDAPTLCPCCGSLPVASISRIDPGAGGLRYLHCSVCSAQWHMVRVKCARCENTKGIHYQSLKPAGESGESLPKAAVEAETCDECGAYLKIVRMERDAQVEPVADDLATVTLDLLVSEAGFQRHGANLMLLFGDPDPPEDAGSGGSG